MRSTISVLSLLFVLVLGETLLASNYTNVLATKADSDLFEEAVANTDFVELRGDDFSPEVRFRFKDPKYVTASFYTATGKNDILFQNNLSLKTRFQADINDRFQAIAQFRCNNFCETLAVSITIIGKATGEVFNQRDMVLARIP